jgi:hypothetical protein
MPDSTLSTEKIPMSVLTAYKTLNRCNSRNGKKGIVHMLDEPSSYQIRLRGHLSPQWATYFDGFTLTNNENGEALLTGVITDQAALHGVLAKIRDLGFPLLSVNRMASGEVSEDADTELRSQEETEL